MAEVDPELPETALGKLLIRQYVQMHGLCKFGDRLHDAAMPETAPVPTPDRKPAWRAAVLAHREQRRAGASDHAFWHAGVAALHAVWPLQCEKTGREATNVIAYASSHHTA